MDLGTTEREHKRIGDTIGRGHGGTGTQQDRGTVRRKGTAIGIQWDGGTMGRNGTTMGKQWDGGTMGRKGTAMEKTMELGHNGTGKDFDGDILGRSHNGTERDSDGNTIGLGHNGTERDSDADAQWADLFRSTRLCALTLCEFTQSSPEFISVGFFFYALSTTTVISSFCLTQSPSLAFLFVGLTVLSVLFALLMQN